jgi:hypothetical protein
MKCGALQGWNFWRTIKKGGVTDRKLLANNRNGDILATVETMASYGQMMTNHTTTASPPPPLMRPTTMTEEEDRVRIRRPRWTCCSPTYNCTPTIYPPQDARGGALSRHDDVFNIIFDIFVVDVFRVARTRRDMPADSRSRISNHGMPSSSPPSCRATQEENDRNENDRWNGRDENDKWDNDAAKTRSVLLTSIDPEGVRILATSLSRTGTVRMAGDDGNDECADNDDDNHDDVDGRAFSTLSSSGGCGMRRRHTGPSSSSLPSLRRVARLAISRDAQRQTGHRGAWVRGTT